MEIFTTYWSQIVLLAAGAGYLIKVFIENKYKKVEINHSVFQQNKINAISAYFAAYAEAELMWNHLSIYEVLQDKVDVKEMDRIVFPSLNKLKKADLELKIYLEPELSRLFEDLTKKTRLINGVLKQVYFNLENEESLSIRVTVFSNYLEDTLEENNRLINELTKKVRKSFNAK